MKGFGLDVWLFTGFIAAFMEGISAAVAIDDNVLIPIGTGLLLTLYTSGQPR